MVVRLLIVDGVKYKLWTPKKELEEFEPIVKKNVKDIFGENSIYFDLKQKLTSRAGVGSIPDGYVITLSDPPQWYVIEVELSTHPLYDHIVPQLSKFIHGIKTYESRRGITEALYEEIKSDVVLEALVKKRIGSSEIYRFLTNLVSSPPILAVVIDEKTKELEEVCNSLPPIEKRIVEFKIFERIDAGIKNAYLFEPLYKPMVKKAPEIPITIPKEFPVISREELASLKEGKVVICPSKPEGVNFLLQYNAWGFVRIRREPEYFALYVSRPESRISFFGEVKEILYPKDPGSPITEEEARRYKEFKEGKKVIVLKPESLRRLDKGIPKGTLKKVLQGLKYVTLSQFISAKTLDDL